MAVTRQPEPTPAAMQPLYLISAPSTQGTVRPAWSVLTPHRSPESRVCLPYSTMYAKDRLTRNEGPQITTRSGPAMACFVEDCGAPVGRPGFLAPWPRTEGSALIADDSIRTLCEGHRRHPAMHRGPPTPQETKPWYPSSCALRRDSNPSLAHCPKLNPPFPIVSAASARLPNVLGLRIHTTIVLVVLLLVRIHPGGPPCFTLLDAIKLQACQPLRSTSPCVCVSVSAVSAPPETP